eukprot:CAMPEP_0197910220 /NCGR_PEP_ID=MMETSP1439-20131203/70467_1 /TAXON_ID=66791 /ORGANISM="Gonyaulax spinifera, Strain CCMP409" /LENGTH=165 /DNA_ID=CAMNT_0043531849 /DNA_START=47 /DNA_END=544 /DNA_ORIENTATION=+
MGATLGLESSAVESKLDLESVLEGVGPDQRERLLTHLDALAHRQIRFKHAAVWRQAFLGGAADHHTLVYEYVAAGRQMSLKIDWGREGLSFKDSAEDPCPNGDIIRRKWCRISPAEVKDQIMEIKDRDYVLTNWNCQHFSAYLFDRAGEAFADHTANSAAAANPS